MIEPSVWKVYQQSATIDKCQYFSEFVTGHGVMSVFEYGCGSAPNLVNISANVGNNIELIGFDINTAAIELAQKALPCGTFFSDKAKLERFLALRNPPHIDLVIFDRVLYLLSERQILNIQAMIFGKVRYIVIDDFHSDCVSAYKKMPYTHRNYIELFYDYVCLNIEDSQHSANHDNACTAKRIVLESRSYSI